MEASDDWRGRTRARDGLAVQPAAKSTSLILFNSFRDRLRAASARSSSTKYQKEKKEKIGQRAMGAQVPAQESRFQKFFFVC